MEFSKFRIGKLTSHKGIRKIVRWSIALFVLYCVFQSIELTKLRLYLQRANPWLVALGLLHAPILILLAALRWQVLLCHSKKIKGQFRYLLNQYWIGLALGFFTPGSLGLDTYRVFATGRRFEGYSASAGVILVEKLFALITCLLIIVVLYPVVPIKLSPITQKVFLIAYVCFFLSLFCAAVIVFAPLNKTFSKVIVWLESYLSRMLNKIKSSLRLGNNSRSWKISLGNLLKPLSYPEVFLIIIFSFGIQLISSVKSQIFFYALGYNLPFIVNLFVAPTLYFIFFLPISLGSLGIREGVYVVLYGLFGVPAEIALLVSFFNLCGILLNNLIGALIMTVFDVNKEIRADYYSLR